MKLHYIDIHSHLNLQPLLENKEIILAKMREMGIGTITVGTSFETSRTAVKIAEENPDICWATVGIHPCECGVLLCDNGESGSRSETSEGWCGNWSELEVLAGNPKVVAIGETGLDYFRENIPESQVLQTEMFKKHVGLAVRVNKPLMLHVRSSKGSDDAYYDALEILGGFAAQNRPRANFHFFSGSKQCMLDIITAGYTVSVDGPITFVGDYDEMIKAVPLDKIMIETDAPYAAPAPYRGKTCEPWMVVEVAKKIAGLKGLDPEMVRLQLIENTKDFFNLDF
jgi:TatD DNase family protein